MILFSAVKDFTRKRSQAIYLHTEAGPYAQALFAHRLPTRRTKGVKVPAPDGEPQRPVQPIQDVSDGEVREPSRRPHWSVLRVNLHNKWKTGEDERDALEQHACIRTSSLQWDAFLPLSHFVLPCLTWVDDCALHMH